MSRMTRERLTNIRREMLRTRKLGSKNIHTRITVHLGTCGIAAGASKILDRITSLLEGHDTRGIQLITSGCAGLCSREPMITIQRPASHQPNTLS